MTRFNVTKEEWLRIDTIYEGFPLPDIIELEGELVNEDDET